MKKISILFTIILFSCITIYSQTVSELETEKEGITNCALDYGIGYYSGDAARMERALHPELNKIVVMKLKPDGKPVLQYSTVSGLVEGSRAKAGLLDESKRDVSVGVYTVDDYIACAKLNSSQFNDYLQMVKVDGKWKIINVLWNFGPQSKQKPVISNFDAEAEKDAIKKCAAEFTEGLIGGDQSKYERNIHPETNIVQVAQIPSTGKLYISKLGPSLIAELIKNKMMAVPENQRSVDVSILNSMDGYSFVKCTTPLLVFYIQMAKIGDNWNVLNVLVNRKSAPKK